MFEGLIDDASDRAAEAVSLSPGLARHAPRLSLDREGETVRWFYFPHEDASMRSSLPPVITPKQYGRGGGSDSRNVSIVRRRQSDAPQWLI